MASDTTPLIPPPGSSPARGTYVAATESDVRSPCPLVNCLANHGYISRSGRNIRSDELATAMNEIGLSTGLGAVFARPIFLECQGPETASTRRKKSLLAQLWYYICNPWAVLFSSFGMRRHGQVDKKGYNVLDLDQLALPGVVEHDISLTRRDHSQGENRTRQPDLIKSLLASSTDDGRTISMEDFAAFRRRRIGQQRKDYGEVQYEAKQHKTACAEIALILNAFGDGLKIPCSYAKALFQEERLPVQEGWHKRGWFSSLGFLELGRSVGKIKKLVGTRI